MAVARALAVRTTGPPACATRVRRLPALRNKETDELKLPTAFHLLLGTAQGKGIRWGRLGDAGS